MWVDFPSPPEREQICISLSGRTSASNQGISGLLYSQLPTRQPGVDVSSNAAQMPQRLEMAGTRSLLLEKEAWVHPCPVAEGEAVVHPAVCVEVRGPHRGLACGSGPLQVRDVQRREEPHVRTTSGRGIRESQRHKEMQKKCAKLFKKKVLAIGATAGGGTIGGGQHKSSWGRYTFYLRISCPKISTGDANPGTKVNRSKIDGDVNILRWPFSPTQQKGPPNHLQAPHTMGDIGGGGAEGCV